MLLLLNNSNLKAQDIPIISQLFDDGVYTDFNSQWWRLTGDLVIGTMIFNSVFPLMINGILAAIRNIKRWRDLKAESGTNQTSIQGYIDLHGGPTFVVHFRYANMLNIIFVTMMYGTALPILFPLAMFSFLVLYFQDQFMLFYVYKTPPTYDESLNKDVLNIFAKAPLFLLSFGFW